MADEIKDTAPQGYMTNRLGGYDPVGTIKQIDVVRDKLVREIVQEAKVLNEKIAKFKGETFGDIAAFIDLSAEQYNVKLRGASGKGNVTLYSYDQRYKIQRAVSEYLVFDERLQAAKSLIDECITDWSQGSRPEIRVLVNDAFQVDKEGRISVGRVLGLRKLDIQDKRWKQAMQAIGDAVQVVGSKSYIRIYERKDGSDEYLPISLDVASA